MSFTSTILQWFRENGRDLPWRQTRDPYAIWLSEIILQQTRIEQGLPYWERFMQHWPTVEQLAAASEDEVLREWQGLGYYSRARHLHEAARQVVAMGGFPRTLEGLRALKGVGEYTAAAIGSFAFGLPAAVVDGNVYRVLARHYGIATPINSTEGKKEFAALAQSLLPAQHCSMFNVQCSMFNVQCSMFNVQPPSSLYNQAMMDFGATQCTPQAPRCSDCPLMETCVALREGTVATLPVKLKAAKVRERRLAYIYIRWQGRTAIHRRGKGDIWQGLYEPLCVEEGGERSVECGAATLILLRQSVRHVLTHRVLLADFYLWQPEEQPPLPDGYFWISEDDIGRYALPRLIEKMVEEVRKHDENEGYVSRND